MSTTLTARDIIKTKYINDEHLPLVIEPANGNVKLPDLLKHLDENNAFYKQELLKYGGLLFRNFPIQNAEDFAKVIAHLKTGKLLDYIGGDSPRKKVTQGVYTSTEAPPSFKIPLHNELSFVKNYPKYIYFYCDIAPAENGETIIADAREVYNHIDESVKRRLAEKKLYYVSHYCYKGPIIDFINKYKPCYKSWTHVFETNDKQEVEKKCRENDFLFKWLQNDWIEVSQKRPAFMVHPETGETVWFNQAHLFDFNPKFLGWWRYLATKALYFRDHMKLHEVFYGDKTKIPQEDLYHILDVLDANTIYFPWQKGDILVLDNVLAMHGRAPFKGKRRILAAMTG